MNNDRRFPREHGHVAFHAVTVVGMRIWQKALMLLFFKVRMKEVVDGSCFLPQGFRKTFSIVP